MTAAGGSVSTIGGAVEIGAAAGISGTGAVPSSRTGCAGAASVANVDAVTAGASAADRRRNQRIGRGTREPRAVSGEASGATGSGATSS
jgi:hypothetical protein